MSLKSKSTQLVYGDDGCDTFVISFEEIKEGVPSLPSRMACDDVEDVVDLCGFLILFGFFLLHH
jgi:hypothetical protein